MNTSFQGHEHSFRAVIHGATFSGDVGTRNTLAIPTGCCRCIVFLFNTFIAENKTPVYLVFW